MRILYDHQIFHFQRVGGISRYFYELFSRFSAGTGTEAVIPFRYTNNEYLLGSGQFTQFVRPQFLGEKDFPGKGTLWAWRDRLFPSRNAATLNQKDVLRVMSEGNFDLYHPTYYDTEFLDTVGSRPVVVTLFDMIYELFPGHFPAEEVRQVLKHKERMLHRADHIIAISHSAKADLLRLYGIADRNVTVIPLGHSVNSREERNEESFLKQLPERFIVFVGNRSGYKNFAGFLRAVKPLLTKDQSLHVVCTGPAFSSDELSSFRKEGIMDRFHHRFASDGQLALLYRHARLFVFPSLYEGFGIPVLEAMSNDCPTVLSAVSALPEVGGDAAVYFDPHNEQAMTAVMEQCLYDEAARSSLIEKGRERAAQFSWDATARDTKEVYGTVLQRSGGNRS